MDIFESPWPIDFVTVFQLSLFLAIRPQIFAISVIKFNNFFLSNVRYQKTCIETQDYNTFSVFKMLKIEQDKKGVIFELY